MSLDGGVAVAVCEELVLGASSGVSEGGGQGSKCV